MARYSTVLYGTVGFDHDGFRFDKLFFVAAYVQACAGVWPTVRGGIPGNHPLLACRGDVCSMDWV